MTFDNFAIPVQLYSQIAGGLAGIVFLCLTLFLNKTEEPYSHFIVMLLASIFWSFVASAFLYAEATGHVPQEAFKHTVQPDDFQLLNMMTLLAGFVFASAIVQTFLCLSYLLQAHGVDNVALKFGNRLVMAAVSAIIGVMVTTAEYVIHQHNPTHQGRWHLLGLAIAITVPLTVLFRFKRGSRNRTKELKYLAYASLLFSFTATAFYIIGATIFGFVATCVCIMVAYVFMFLLGLLMAQCLICRPRLKRQFDAATLRR